MTDQSRFNERADAAARALKAQMGLQPSPVPDGQPLAEPPPGSYAALQRAQQAIQEHAEHVTGSPAESPVRGSETGEVATPTEPEQPVDAADVGPDGKHVAFKDHPIYTRFAEVSREATARRKELEDLRNQYERERGERDALKRRFEALEREHNEFLQGNLDSLDPDKRAQVLMEARMRSELVRMEEKIQGTLQPHLQALWRESRFREVERLAARYPHYDAEKHQPLIDLFQERNPASTMEMAFKAIADPEELHLNGAPAQSPTPPSVVVPSSRNSQPRFLPDQSGSDELAELRRGAARVRELGLSEKPADRSASMTEAARSIRDRYLR